LKESPCSQKIKSFERNLKSTPMGQLFCSPLYPK
jgi:hypothetical protein